MTFLHHISAAQSEVEDRQRTYLIRWGWTMTSNTPGAFWLWRRDFADVDAKRKAWDDEHDAGQPGKPSKSQPYGVITAPTDIAIAMTARCLDDQPELGEADDEAA